MKIQEGGSGASRESVGRRDFDRLVWADKQQRRRDVRDQRSGVFGYGMLAGHRHEEEEEE